MDQARTFGLIVLIGGRFSVSPTNAKRMEGKKAKSVRSLSFPQIRYYDDDMTYNAH